MVLRSVVQHISLRRNRNPRHRKPALQYLPHRLLPIPSQQKPVRLACGHIFGDQCLKEWLSPAPQGFHNKTCPTCRFGLTEGDPVFGLTLLHLEWLETLDYDCDGHRRMMLEGVAQHVLNNDQEARQVFRSRVQEERQKELEILELRREVLRVQQRAFDLQGRFERARNEQVEQEAEHQRLELSQLTERLEQQRVEMMRSVEGLDGELREAAMYRCHAFFGSMTFAEARRNLGQEHHDY